jgi:hypothetical protein
MLPGTIPEGVAVGAAATGGAGTGGEGVGAGVTAAVAGFIGRLAGWAFGGGAEMIEADGAAGATAAAGGGAVGGAAVLAGSGVMVARTAVWQPSDRPATFFCRQESASLPPGVTPAHFDWKSEWQFERIALCCAEVTCAAALVLSAAKAASAAQGSKTRRKLCVVRLMESPVGSSG